MATNQFNINYHIWTANGFVFINGEQITKFEAIKKEDNWDIVFHLSDGTSHTIAANNWTKTFAPKILEGLVTHKE